MAAHVACFATQGTGHREEERIVELLEAFDPDVWGFDRSRKRAESWRLLGRALRQRPDLVVMEGTGLAGGLALLAARLVGRVPFVVSTGDAVGPFLARRSWLLGPPAAAYERLLYRFAEGVIGWTPYMAGRAITLGARRAMFAANWAPNAATEAEGRGVRAKLGLKSGDIAFGIVGSLEWNASVGYCYGAELVRAVGEIDRPDVKVVVVGDGSGLEHLRALAGDRLGETVLLPGRVPRDEVQAHLRALDVGSLPQSLDPVGALRYTTKLSEYVAAGLPTVTGQLPLAYEFDDGWLWRLPGEAPWDGTYISSLANLMRSVTVDDVRVRTEAVPVGDATFDLARQKRQVTAFIQDLLTDPR